MEVPSFKYVKRIIRVAFTLHNMVVKIVGGGTELDEGGTRLDHHNVVAEFGAMST